MYTSMNHQQTWSNSPTQRAFELNQREKHDADLTYQNAMQPIIDEMDTAIDCVLALKEAGMEDDAKSLITDAYAKYMRDSAPIWKAFRDRCAEADRIYALATRPAALVRSEVKRS